MRFQIQQIALVIYLFLIFIPFGSSQVLPFFGERHECGVIHPPAFTLRAAPPVELNYSLINTLPDTIVIPVVVHLIHNGRQENLTNAEVVAMLQQCNRQINMEIENFDQTPEVFKKLAAKTRIQLRLAKKDPNGKCTDGIVRVETSLTDMYSNHYCSGPYPQDKILQMSHWPPERYLNLYIIRRIVKPDGGSIPGAYGTFPFNDFSCNTGKGRDGIFITYESLYNYSTRISTTLSHELGHWLGLYHIWGNAGSSDDSCFDSDGIADTPNQSGPSSVCFDRFPFITCNNGPNGNMFTNFMDYGNCLTQFTPKQVEKMHAVLTTSASGRSDLWSTLNRAVYTRTTSPYNFNTGCVNEMPIASFRTTSNNGVFTIPTVDSYFSQVSSQEFFKCGDAVQIDFTNTSSFNAARIQWSFEGGIPSTSTALNPSIIYKKGGTYQVKMIAFNQSGSDTTVQNIKIIDYDNRSYPPQNAKENFENYQHIDEYGWSNTSFDQNRWVLRNTDGYKGGKCLYINNFGDNDKYAMFRTPSYDLNGQTSAKLVFKVAKSQVNASTTETVLRIFTLGQCYESMVMLKNLYDTDLSIDKSGKGAFIPQEGDWKTVSIELPKDLLKYQKVSFVFFLRDFDQSDIYIDDIELQTSPLTSVADIKPQVYFQASPNPAASELKLNYESPLSTPIQFRLIGVDGRAYALKGGSSNTGTTQQYTFPLPDLPNGMYVVQATQDGYVASTKVVILR